MLLSFFLCILPKPKTDNFDTLNSNWKMTAINFNCAMENVYISETMNLGIKTLFLLSRDVFSYEV